MSNIIKMTDDLLFDMSIENPFVDVFEIIKQKGINLSKINFEDDISGVLDLRNSEEPYIFINENHSLNRQRFSAAHELGHFLLHVESGLHMDKQSFYRNTLSHEGTSLIEIEANRFAAELLMPRRMLKRDLREYIDLIDTDKDPVKELAKKYKVSTTAMSIKIQPILEDLGYMSFSL